MINLKENDCILKDWERWKIFWIVVICNWSCNFNNIFDEGIDSFEFVEVWFGVIIWLLLFKFEIDSIELL